MSGIPRLRMFAGPNGSGKTHLKSMLPLRLLGYYVNPDEIEKTIRDTGVLQLKTWGIQTTESELQNFFSSSFLLKSQSLEEESKRIMIHENSLWFSNVSINSYYASVISDYIRKKLLQMKADFTFETVMSHESKVELLKEARHQGYRTYLYYIATEDAEINVFRVKNRVHLGGHHVSEQRIRERYTKSLELLLEAIKHSNRAYIFDNSGHDREHTWIAESTDGTKIEIKCDQVPLWFKRFVLDKLVK